MYYLKTIDGERTRFNSLTDIFEFLENEIRKCGWRWKPRFCNSAHRHSYSYYVPRLIADSFVSTKRSGSPRLRVDGCIDTRNKGVGLFKNFWGGEPQLVCDNKYIVLDAFGRIVSSKWVIDCYCDRFAALWAVKYAYNGYRPYPSGVTSGYKGINWKAQLKFSHFCRRERTVMDNRGRHHDEPNIRGARRESIKSLMPEYDEWYRNPIRSWKSQGKKRKQWMK